MLRLNLGCCDRAIRGFLGVDLVPPADVIADLSQPWPWPDSSVDEVAAYAVIEHIANRIHLLNELHRVLKPGAVAIVETPDAAKGPGFWQDPTHISGWTKNSFQYFESGSFAHQRLARAYGITAVFRVLELGERRYADLYEPVFKLTVKLQAVK